MSNQASPNKMSTRELVASVVSVLIIISGIVYWSLEALAMIDLVQLAYEYSLLQIIGRFLLVVLATSAVVSITIFIQSRVNKGL